MELGAQTQIDEKNDRFIVNGSHDEAKLQDILGMPEKFLQLAKSVFRCLHQEVRALLEM